MCTNPEWCDESTDCWGCPYECTDSMTYHPDKGWMFNHELGRPCDCAMCQSVFADPNSVTEVDDE